VLHEYCVDLSFDVFEVANCAFEVGRGLLDAFEFCCDLRGIIDLCLCDLSKLLVLVHMFLVGVRDMCAEFIV